MKLEDHKPWNIFRIQVNLKTIISNIHIQIQYNAHFGFFHNLKYYN